MIPMWSTLGAGKGLDKLNAITASHPEVAWIMEGRDYGYSGKTSLFALLPLLVATLVSLFLRVFMLAVKVSSG